MKKSYKQIQDEVVAKYRVTLDEHSSCRMRTHAHVKERRVCKWRPKNSFHSTFVLLHEIGHIETHKRTMKRCESEYYATCWAIDRCKEYGLEVTEKELHDFQQYVLLEVARGKIRNGKGYNIDSMNLYKYAGYSKTIEEFKSEIHPYWKDFITSVI